MNRALQELVSKDKELEKIITRIQIPEIQSTKNVFHDLMSCIIEQQIHYRSTKKTFQKLLIHSGIHQLTIENFRVFETAGLQKANLSMKKWETIQRTLDFFEESKIDWFKLTDQELRTTLKGIGGIGPWTQDMILLYTLERPNIIPYEDYHLKEIMTKVYGLNPNSGLKAQMKSIGANWHPHGSVATRILFEWKKSGGISLQ
jgi:DNA-3-methyladenine glycosylase II